MSGRGAATFGWPATGRRATCIEQLAVLYLGAQRVWRQHVVLRLQLESSPVLSVRRMRKEERRLGWYLGPRGEVHFLDKRWHTIGLALLAFLTIELACHPCFIAPVICVALML